MRKEDETNCSIDASFSDFCSVGERVSQSHREQVLTKENSRLRRQLSQISEKYIKMCNEHSKQQTKLLEKERKITQLDIFYRREIEDLKKEVNKKTAELAKIQKQRTSKVGNKNKENESNNVMTAENMSICMENQSLIILRTQQQNERLYNLLNSAVELLQPYSHNKQKTQISRRILNLRKQLQQKGNLDTIYKKSNQMLQSIRTGQQNQENEIARLLEVLKNKNMQLKKIPLTLDYDIEAESAALDLLMTDLDIQISLFLRNQ